ncbi:MAG: hypothetical protein K0M50_18080 [Prolixibacteraceae bacterium]|nr:hypothetical protein [Prolixibacteraceae bacterium]
MKARWNKLMCAKAFILISFIPEVSITGIIDPGKKFLTSSGVYPLLNKINQTDLIQNGRDIKMNPRKMILNSIEVLNSTRIITMPVLIKVKMIVDIPITQTGDNAYRNISILLQFERDVSKSVPLKSYW